MQLFYLYGGGHEYRQKDNVFKNHSYLYVRNFNIATSCKAYKLYESHLLNIILSESQ